MDYQGIGFKCGIEIHQQLETKKLFCSCPSIVHDDDPDIHFHRKLRAVIGETGEIDAAAAHEQAQAKTMKYEACSTSSCLVEMDEEPPHEMNQEALGIVLQVAHMLHARVVDEIQVMRKTVVDGSNVSGFQRTALVAMDGYIETSKGRVGIPSICIEEESAKKITSDDKSVTYRLDRLGVPLIEIATDPDIIDAEHAKETAEKLGMVLRSTGKVKRGIGTIRQDVNVSITGGSRVELKGFQELKYIPNVVDNEIRRQQEIIGRGEEVPKEVRKANPDGSSTFLRPMPGAARMYPETDVLPVQVGSVEVEEIELIDAKIQRIAKEQDLGEDLVRQLIKEDKLELFESVMKTYPDLKSTFVADTLVSVIKDVRRKDGIDLSVLHDELFVEVFGYIAEGQMAKESVTEALVAMHTKAFSLDDFRTMDEGELRKGLLEIVSSMEGKPFGAVMGEAMKRFRGKVDGQKISDILKELTS